MQTLATLRLVLDSYKPRTSLKFCAFFFLIHRLHIKLVPTGSFNLELLSFCYRLGYRSVSHGYWRGNSCYDQCGQKCM